MRIDILAVIPEIVEGAVNTSILKKAQENNTATIKVHSLRAYSEDRFNRIDDYAYSAGAGMVLKIEPVYKAINHLKSQRDYDEIIYTSPDGEKLTQQASNQLSTYKNIIILCGHYKGIDQRIRDHLVTREISIGDYVLTGGELAAAVIADSVVRLLPGAMGDETSALTDSFQDGLLAPPVYTRPADFNGWKVPEILLSGNDALIEEWKLQQAIDRTRLLRPDLYKLFDDEQ
ncbi:MAG: tRNA (guanosine(37)-N1)-methyltransferase TrmD [Salinivirgaceae bacterium]